jgi:hypothetical protein
VQLHYAFADVTRDWATSRASTRSIKLWVDMKANGLS